MFCYVNHLTSECETHGCEGDILIMSGGIGELLNSTLLDSFTGVRYVRQATATEIFRALDQDALCAVSGVYAFNIIREQYIIMLGLIFCMSWNQGCARLMSHESNLTRL